MAPIMATRCGRIGRSASALLARRRHCSARLGLAASRTPRPAAGASAAAAIVEPLRPFRASAGSTGRRTQRLAFSGKAPSDPEKEGASEAEEAPRVEINFVGEDPEGAGGSGRADDAEIDRSKFTHEVKFRMPDLGDAGEEDGVVVKWYKKEGDIIRKGDTMCDVRTELFEFGMDSDDEKVTIMGEILVPEGNDPVEPGEVLCMILHEETGTGEEKNPE